MEVNMEKVEFEVGWVKIKSLPGSLNNRDLAGK